MKNKGFSLVELIVVIAIMAILVGVAVPVYTSYIDKADRAKDEQLLEEINQAFAVVCAGEALYINTVTDATIAVAADGAIDLAGMTVKVGDVTITTLGTKMVEILGEDLEFNVIEKIWYNSTTRRFEEQTGVLFTYGGVTFMLDEADIAALKNSAFGEIGVEALLSKVDLATSFATNIEPTSQLAQLIYSQDNFNALAIALGFELPDEANEFEAAFYALMVQKAQQMAADAGSDDVDAYMNAASNAILANNAVLIAATNSNISDEFVASLSNGEALDAVLENLDNAQNAEGMAQAAFAYAMYTSYKQSTEEFDADEPIDITDVKQVLESDGFKTYMSGDQAKADMAGYFAAMNMINDSCTEDTVAQLLVNGFADESLVGEIDKIVGTND